MIAQQMDMGNLTVRQIRELKSQIKTDTFDAGPMTDQVIEISSSELKRKPHMIRLTKKTILVLRITLARMDNLIDEVHSTVDPADRAEIVSFLMSTRLRIHSLIDETIRYKNTFSQKEDLNP
jgi:ParB family chromosome partitioning protein